MEDVYDNCLKVRWTANERVNIVLLLVLKALKQSWEGLYEKKLYNHGTYHCLLTLWRGCRRRWGSCYIKIFIAVICIVATSYRCLLCRGTKEGKLFLCPVLALQNMDDYVPIISLDWRAKAVLVLKVTCTVWCGCAAPAVTGTFSPC